MAETPEGRIQSKIVSYLKELSSSGVPLFYEKRQAGGFSYKEGMADIYVVIRGVHIEIEVKTPEGELRTMQEKWIAKMNKYGIPCMVATSMNDVKKYLEDFGLL